MELADQTGVAVERTEQRSELIDTSDLKDLVGAIFAHVSTIRNQKKAGNENNKESIRSSTPP